MADDDAVMGDLSGPITSLFSGPTDKDSPGTKKHFTPEEEEELLRGDLTNLEKEVDRSRDAELLGVAATAVKEVGHNTRSKVKALESSSAPKDVVERVGIRLDSLRATLLKREVDTKRKRDAISEFESMFDKERVLIEDDLLIIKSAFTVTANYEGEKRKLEKQYLQKEVELRIKNDEIAQVLEGTNFTRIEELRFKFNELSDRIKIAEENEQAILDEVGVETMRDVIVRAKREARVDDAAGVSRLLFKQTDDLLNDTGHKDFLDLADEVKAMREENNRLHNAEAYRADILDEMMKQWNVTVETDIIQVIQKSIEEYKATEADLRLRLAQAHDLIDGMKRERLIDRQEIETWKKKDLERETRELSSNDKLMKELNDIRAQMQVLQHSSSGMRQPERHSPPASAGMTSPPHGSGGTNTTVMPSGANLFNVDEGNSDCLGSSLNPAMLPLLDKYDGGKEKWESFKNGFLVRYGRMRNSDAHILLTEFLTGKARLEYQSLPEEYRTKPIRDCLEWLKDRILGGSRYQAIELDRKLRDLKVGNKRVEQVCQDVEYLVHKLHSETEKQEEIKQRQLVFLYEFNREWYSGLLRMMDTGSSYAEMKEYLMREEYVERRLATNKSNVGGTTNQPRNHNKGVSNAGRDRMSKTKCFCCEGIGHEELRCPSKRDAKGHFTDLQCFVCGGKGHTSKVCISDQSVKFLWKAMSGQSEAQNGGAAQSSSTSPGSGANVVPLGNGGYNGGCNGGRRGGYGGSGNASKPAVRMLALKCEEVKDVVENKVSFQQTSEKVCSGVETRIVNNTHTADACGRDEIQGINISLAAKEDERDENNKGSDADDPFYVKRSQLVKGVIGGIQVEACLDTGAEVNLIDRSTVEKMSGVKIEPGNKWNIQDAQKNSVKTLGTVVLDVNMEIGRACKVGFVVSDADIANILLGNGALDSMGLALRMKEEEKPVKPPDLPDNVVVLRTAYVGPGQMSTILVGGGRERGAKVLITDREEVIEGINDGESIVRVPVWNNTNEDLMFEQHEVIGVWCRVSRPDNEEVAKSNALLVNQINGHERKINWKEIKENLESCRGGKLSKRMEEIIRARADVFAVEDSDLGRLKGMMCDVRLDNGVKPIRQKERPVPFSLKPALRILLDKMMSQGVIRKSNSPWLSPVVLVKKKDGSIRICIDFRRVNEVTKEDAFPLPNIENILQSLQGRKVFTVMDLSSGFWQLPLNERSAEVTAFATMGELYEFSVLPFGLNVSPAIFQRAMSEVLKDELSKEGREKVVHCYIDDVLIATETEEEHETVLSGVIDKLRSKGLLLNMKKCKIMVDEIDYLGHKLTKSGLHINERKVQAIREYKRPETMSQLSQFLGVTGYHRRFVEGYARIVNPLTRLVVTSGKKLLWTNDAIAAFECLKEKIACAPVLGQPDYSAAMDGSRPFILTTDASGSGIGAIMSQKGVDGVERTLAFYSRSLKESERGLSVVDTEALAVYEAVIRWRHMTLGTKTVVRTDHQPLVTLLKRKHVASRLLRWATELQEYDLEIEHIKGKTNVVADALSRNPRDEPPEEDNGFSADVGIVVNAITRSKTEAVRLEEEKRRKSLEDSEESENKKQWITDQSKDDWVVSMLEKLKEVGEGKRDVAEEVTTPGTIKRTSLADWIVQDGILYLLGYDHAKKLYIPEGRRERFVQEIHDSPLSGHLSSKKMVQKLSNEVFWGSMMKDVQNVLKKCKRCLLANPQKKMIPPLQPLIANDRMEVVGMDLIEMGRGKNGGKYIVTIIDHFSKFGGAYVVKDKKAETVADVFISRWVCEGCRVPKILVSDNGSELVNQIMAEIARRFQIDRKLTLPYHSRANGLTERFNRTIVEIMRRIKMRDDEWEEALPYALFAYNSSPHGSTGETPSYLMYLRDETLPNSQLPKSNPAYTVDLDVSDYKRRMSWMLEKTRLFVLTKLENERRKMKMLYDVKHKHNMNIKPVKGDRVYIRVEPKVGDIKKMMSHFEGPYRVISTSNTTATVVRADNGLEDGRMEDKRVVQFDRLRLVPRDENNESNKVATVCRITASADNQCSDFRPRVDVTSPLHPDYSCEPCGKRLAAGMFKKEDMGDVGRLPFANLRELAAIIDLKEDWCNLTASEANRAVREKMHKGDISTRAFRTAYEKGQCIHAIEVGNEMSASGVFIAGESNAISDVITEVISGSRNRLYKKNCVILLPEDSPVAKCGGEWREVEVLKYRDWEELKSTFLSMEDSGSIPKSLWVVLKSTLAKANLEELKIYCGRISEDHNVTSYVSADLLPVEPEDIKTESIKAHQEFLTAWRLEKPHKNVIVISPISGMIWSIQPFVNLFVISRKESKNLFEKAIRHVIDGKPFAQEYSASKPVSVAVKRSFPSKTQSKNSRGEASSSYCSECKKGGHSLEACWKNKKNKKKRLDE